MPCSCGSDSLFNFFNKKARAVRAELNKQYKDTNMDNTNSQAETPKFKIGDLVWIPTPRSLDYSRSVVFVQTTIAGVVYSRLDGKSTFFGYITANEGQCGAISASVTFATREEAEALIDRLDAEVKAELEGK